MPAVATAHFIAFATLTETLDSPTSAIAIAGILTVAIVVPTFRWMMKRIDHHQEQQGRLINSLERSVRQQGEWRSEDRELHRKLIEASTATIALLQAMQRSSS